MIFVFFKFSHFFDLLEFNSIKSKSEKQMQFKELLPEDLKPSKAKKFTPILSILSFFLYIESTFSSKLVAAVYTLISTLCYTLAGILTKQSSHIPPYQLVYQRAFYEIIITFITISMTKGTIFVRNSNTHKLIMIRGFVGGLAMVFYFHGIYYLPLSILVVLFMLNPLWIGLTTAFLEKKLNCYIFASLAASFLGMILIMKPGMNGENMGDTMNFYIGVALAILSSIFSSIAFFTIRSLKGKVQTPTIVFYFNLYSLLFCGFGQLFEGAIALNYKDHIVLFGIGILGWGGQMLRSRSFILEKVFFVSVLMYSQIAFSYLADIFILKLEIDLLSNIGCLVIGSAMIGLIYRENKENNNK